MAAGLVPVDTDCPNRPGSVALELILMLVDNVVIYPEHDVPLFATSANVILKRAGFTQQFHNKFKLCSFSYQEI